MAGSSLDVLATLGEQKGLMLVPTVAIQPHDDGAAAYVLNDDDSVNVRAVTVALRVGDMSGISEGLKVGDRLVTEGQQSLAKRQQVQVQTNSQSADTSVPGNKSNATHDGSVNDSSRKQPETCNGRRKTDQREKVL